jgi:hypothetical protein
MKIPGKPRFWATTSIVVVVLWVAGALALSYFLDRGDKKDPPCPQSAQSSEGPASGVPPPSPVDLGTTDEKLEIDFGVTRGASSDEIRLNAPSAPPTGIAVAPSSLTGDAGTIDAGNVRVRATSLRDTVLLDVCLDIRTAGRVHSGSYSGVVIFTDTRVKALTVPLIVNVQGPYLYYLCPLILILPLLGLLIVWTTASKVEDTNFGKGALTTFIAAVAATAAVFGAQGLSNPAWGGGPLTAGALVAAMYTAATGVTATLGSAAGQVKLDNS